jgi:hypothetical protein
LWERVRGDLESLGDEPEEEGERIPCPDETCVGLIGEDGFCGVCGRAKASGEGFAEAAQEQADSAQVHAGPEEEDEEPDADDDPERVLCSDDACIGLVGEDDYCRVCGLRWKADGYAEGEDRVYKEVPGE